MEVTRGVSVLAILLVCRLLCSFFINTLFVSAIICCQRVAQQRRLATDRRYQRLDQGQTNKQPYTPEYPAPCQRRPG